MTRLGTARQRRHRFTGVGISVLAVVPCSRARARQHGETVKLTGLSRNTLKEHFRQLVEKRLLAKAGRRSGAGTARVPECTSDLYRRVDGRVRLNIKDGALALSSLAQTPGLAVGVTPDWNAMQPMLS